MLGLEELERQLHAPMPGELSAEDVAERERLAIRRQNAEAMREMHEALAKAGRGGVG